MTNSRNLVDPTSERSPVQRERLPRLASLSGKTIGLLDIAKPQGDLFLDQLEKRLQEQGVSIKRYRKPTPSRVAPVDLAQEISSQCDAVIEALAD